MSIQKITRRKVVRTDIVKPASLNPLALLSKHMALFLRLLFDGRVSFWIKLVPFAVPLIYTLTPVDWAIVGPFDNIGVIVLAYFLFLQLCPRKIVKELSR